MRRIGVLMNLSANDPEGPPRIEASCRHFNNLAGLSAIICKSTTAGAQETPTVIANTRQN